MIEEPMFFDNTQYHAVRLEVKTNACNDRIQMAFITQACRKSQRDVWRQLTPLLNIHGMLG